MARQQRITLSDELGTLQLPKEIQKIGDEAIQALWDVSQRMALSELEHKRVEYQRLVSQQEEEKKALEKINEKLTLELTNLKRDNESLLREYKVIRHDLESKNVQLQVNHAQLVELNEKNHNQEQEVRRLLEEQGRVQEALETCQRRYENSQNQCQQDAKTVRKLEEELAVQARYRERLEGNLRSLHGELDQQQEKIKVEQQKTAQMEGAISELRDVIKKNEQDYQSLKAENYELREKLESETRSRSDIEKKAAGIHGQLEAVETAYQAQLQKLEQELHVIKAESTNLRNRMIKAESGLERELKRSERLEAKLMSQK
jgi:chromosome segregation ATPase